MRITTLLLIFFNIIISVNLSFSSPYLIIKTDYGYVLYSNSNGDYHTIKIEGDTDASKWQLSSSIYFNLNNEMYQFTTALYNNFISNEEINKNNLLNILLKHQSWESSYIEELLGIKLNINSKTIQDKNGKVYLMWDYIIPDNIKLKIKVAKEIRKNIFITTNIKKSVLIIQGMLLKKDDEDQMIKDLQNIAFSLKIYDNEISDELLKKLIKKY